MIEGQNGLFDGQDSNIYNMLRRKPASGTSYDTETFVKEYCLTWGGGPVQALKHMDFVENRMADDFQLETVCSRIQAEVQRQKDPDNLDVVPYNGEMVAVLRKIPARTAVLVR